MKHFVIYNADSGLYWSNEIGWVDAKSATVFSEIEAMSFKHLPGNGSRWKQRKAGPANKPRTVTA